MPAGKLPAVQSERGPQRPAQPRIHLAARHIRVENDDRALLLRRLKLQVAYKPVLVPAVPDKSSSVAAIEEIDKADVGGESWITIRVRRGGKLRLPHLFE